MSQATRSSGVGVGHSSEKMICVECFRSKGDGHLKMPCQNPRCHFYLCTPSSFVTSRQDIHPTDMQCHLPSSLSKKAGQQASPSFNKEVGHDRKNKPPCHKTSAVHPGQLSGREKVWPVDPGIFNAPLGNMPAQRIHSWATPAGSEGNTNSIQKLLADYHTSLLLNKEARKPKYLHSHLVSLPGSYLGREAQGDLVEDAFFSSPLLTDYEEGLEEDRFGYGTPERNFDCGYAGSTGLVDWMEEPPRTPITSAVATTSASTSTFDMTQLKMELPKATMKSLATNGRISSPESTETLSRASVANIADILGLGGLLQCSEIYSKKVFVGGLPPDADEDDIRIFFMRYGSLTVDWPHKSHSKGSIPPKGYAFLLFKSESAVHKLLLDCTPEEDKHFIFMPTSNLTKKKVQIRPWYITDSYHTVDTSKPIDPRKAVFVGGVPRPLKASELAEVMTEKYGNVALIVIDSDSDLKYPKGAACVVFSSHGSYIAAVSARFMQLNYGSLDKKVEIKPYVLDRQMCDECNGVQCNRKPAPFFCGSVTCLKYYCEYCWATVHSMPGQQNHRPLLKDIGDKARFY